MIQIPRHINKETQYDQDLEYAPERRTYISIEHHAKDTAETLAKRFCIGPEQAKTTLRATKQKGKRSAILPIGYRYRADRMFDIKRLSGKFGTDTIWSKTRSITKTVASQIYTHKCGFNWIYHLQRANREQVGHSFSVFTSEFGAPEHLTYDGAAVQLRTNTSFMDTVRRA